MLVGEAPRDIERPWEKRYRGTLYYGRRGAAIHALSGADIALWDLLGKATGLPVCQLLGGAYHRRTPASSSDLIPFTPAEAGARAAFLRDTGFTHLKFGWGGIGQNETTDVALIRAVRQAIGADASLLTDAGLCWDAATAQARIRRLEAFRLTWIEEPLPPDDLDGYARLADAIETRIAAGEEASACWEFAALMNRGRMDVVQVDVSRAGGRTESRRIAQRTRQRNLPCVPHAYSTGVLRAASLPWAASLLNGWLVEYTVAESSLATGLNGTGLLHEPLRAQDGWLTVPDGPGLGIELDKERIAKYRVA